MKDRLETERKILEAVTGIVGKDGMKSLGINRIAEEAGCSKVLIYRYFGGYDGLLSRWAEENNYWIRKTRGLGLEAVASEGIERKKEISLEVFGGQIRELRGSGIMRELIRWQLNEDNPVCSRIMAKAEEHGLGLTRALLANTETGADVEAMTAVLTSGIHYLTLLADHAPVFNGIDLETDAGWSRIEAAVGQIVDMMFTKIEEK